MISPSDQTSVPMTTAAGPIGSPYSATPAPTTAKPRPMVTFSGQVCAYLVTRSSKATTTKPFRATAKVYQNIAMPTSCM